MSDVNTCYEKGWEIADKVERHIGNIADIEFIKYSAYEGLKKELDNMDKAYIKRSEECAELTEQNKIMRETIVFIYKHLDGMDDYKLVSDARARAKETLERCEGTASGDSGTTTKGE